MSSGLMKTEKGGEQTQYEGEYIDQIPHKKSGGQMGTPATTTDRSLVEGAAERQAARGEQTAANIRYGQAISEGGMSGFTTGQDGKAQQEGYGRIPDQGAVAGASAVQARRATGYGGTEDHNREVGA